MVKIIFGRLNEMKNALFFALFLVFSASLLQAESRVCSVCGKTCTGGYYQLGNETFCSETCLGKKYFCSSCGVTLGIGPNTKFQIVTDINEKKLFFCASCMQKPGCVHCGSRKQTEKVNGSLVCATCREVMITKTEQAVPLLKEAQQLLAETFHFPINPKIKMEVVSREEFERRTARQGLPAYAEAVHMTSMNITSQLSPDEKTILVEVNEIDSGMLVISGAPRAKAFDSIVHELTHDFLRKDCYTIDDEVIEEGFCEAVAAICSTLRGNPKLAKDRFKNDLPVYGEGFRKMYAMLQEKGWEETLKFIKSHSLTRKQYIRKNLLTCIDPGQAAYIKEKHLNPKVVFGKVEDVKK